VLMKDVVTFTIGLLCFLVAGAVFTFAEKGFGELKGKSRSGKPGNDEDSDRTTKENRARRGYGKAAS
jgi:hypothetical protein